MNEVNSFVGGTGNNSQKCEKLTEIEGKYFEKKVFTQVGLRNNKTYKIIKHYAGTPLHYGNKWDNTSIEQTSVYGSLSPMFSGGNTIGIFPDSIEIYNKKIDSQYDSPIRYMRVSLPYRKVTLSNLVFYYKDPAGEEKR